MTATTGRYNISAQPHTKEQWDQWFAVTAPFIADEERACGHDTGLRDPAEPLGWCPECGSEVVRDYPWYRCPGCDASLEEEQLKREPPEVDGDAY